MWQKKKDLLAKGVIYNDKLSSVFLSWMTVSVDINKVAVLTLYPMTCILQNKMIRKNCE